MGWGGVGGDCKWLRGQLMYSWCPGPTTLPPLETFYSPKKHSPPPHSPLPLGHAELASLPSASPAPLSCTPCDESK